MDRFGPVLASDASRTWLERIDRYLELDPAQFAFVFLTRSMRITHTHLQLAPTEVSAADGNPFGKPEHDHKLG